MGSALLPPPPPRALAWTRPGEIFAGRVASAAPDGTYTVTFEHSIAAVGRGIRAGCITRVFDVGARPRVYVRRRGAGDDEPIVAAGCATAWHANGGTYDVALDGGGVARRLRPEALHVMYADVGARVAVRLSLPVVVEDPAPDAGGCVRVRPRGTDSAQTLRVRLSDIMVGGGRGDLRAGAHADAVEVATGILRRVRNAATKTDVASSHALVAADLATVELDDGRMVQVDCACVAREQPVVALDASVAPTLPDGWVPHVGARVFVGPPRLCACSGTYELGVIAAVGAGARTCTVELRNGCTVGASVEQLSPQLCENDVVHVRSREETQRLDGKQWNRGHMLGVVASVRQALVLSGGTGVFSLVSEVGALEVARLACASLSVAELRAAARRVLHRVRGFCQRGGGGGKDARAATDGGDDGDDVGKPNPVNMCVGALARACVRMVAVTVTLCVRAWRRLRAGRWMRKSSSGGAGDGANPYTVLLRRLAGLVSRPYALTAGMADEAVAALARAVSAGDFSFVDNEFVTRWRMSPGSGEAPQLALRRAVAVFDRHVGEWLVEVDEPAADGAGGRCLDAYLGLRSWYAARDARAHFPYGPPHTPYTYIHASRYASRDRVHTRTHFPVWAAPFGMALCAPPCHVTEAQVHGAGVRRLRRAARSHAALAGGARPARVRVSGPRPRAARIGRGRGGACARLVRHVSERRSAPRQLEGPFARWRRGQQGKRVASRRRRRRAAAAAGAGAARLLQTPPPSHLSRRVLRRRAATRLTATMTSCRKRMVPSPRSVRMAPAPRAAAWSTRSAARCERGSRLPQRSARARRLTGWTSRASRGRRRTLMACAWWGRRRGPRGMTRWCFASSRTGA